MQGAPPPAHDGAWKCDGQGVPGGSGASGAAELSGGPCPARVDPYSLPGAPPDLYKLPEELLKTPEGANAIMGGTELAPEAAEGAGLSEGALPALPLFGDKKPIIVPSPPKEIKINSEKLVGHGKRFVRIGHLESRREKIICTVGLF